MGANDILLVDDEERMTKSIGRFLRAKYKVTTASGPAEAFDLLPSCEPAVIVSDFRMPDGDGVDLLTEVAKHYPTVSRILLTGFADVDTVIGAINRARVFRVLLKPVAPDELRTAVEAGVEEHLLTVTSLGLDEASTTSELFDVLVRNHMPEAPEMGRQLAERVQRLADELAVPAVRAVSAAHHVPSVLAVAHGRSVAGLLAPKELTTFTVSQVEMLAPIGRQVAAAAGLANEVVELVDELRDLTTNDPRVSPEARILRFATTHGMVADIDGIKALVQTGRHAHGLVEAALRAEDAHAGAGDVELAPAAELVEGDHLGEQLQLGSSPLRPGHALRASEAREIHSTFAGAHVLRRRRSP